MNFDPKMATDSQEISPDLGSLNATRSGIHLDEVQQLEKCDENAEIPLINDDCLLDIFSYLPNRDLLSISDCDHRFKALADIAASDKYKKEKFWFNYSDARDASLIRRFGKFMREISAVNAYGNYAQHKLSWLKHCTSLKTLTIREMIVWRVEGELAKTVGNLENLTLDRFDGSLCSLGTFLRACKSLKSINIILDREFYYEPFTKQGELLSHVTQLLDIEKISIIFDTRSWLTPHIHEIAKIAQLKKLKFLKMEFDGYNYAKVVDVLSGSQSLEELVLKMHGDVGDDLAKALDKFPNLKLCTVDFQSWKPRTGRGRGASKFEPETDNFRVLSMTTGRATFMRNN